MIKRLSDSELLSLSHLILGPVSNIIEKEVKKIYKLSRKIRRDKNHPLYSRNGFLKAYIKTYKELFENLEVTKRGCWIKTEKDHYRQFHFEGKKVVAHRLSYYLMQRDWDSSKIVCHFCDVKNCVNFLHLFLGTQQDNMIDYRLRLKESATYTWLT